MFHKVICGKWLFSYELNATSSYLIYANILNDMILTNFEPISTSVLSENIRVNVGGNLGLV